MSGQSNFRDTFRIIKLYIYPVPEKPGMALAPVIVHDMNITRYASDFNNL
jgi:hypothetical protein